MKVETKYKIGDRVYIFKIDRIGIVKAIDPSIFPVGYGIVYLEKSKKRVICCIEDEISNRYYKVSKTIKYKHKLNGNVKITEDKLFLRVKSKRK